MIPDYPRDMFSDSDEETFEDTRAYSLDTVCLTKRRSRSAGSNKNSFAFNRRAKPEGFTKQTSKHQTKGNTPK